MTMFWLNVLSNLLTGISFLLIALLTYWFSRKLGFRFRNILLGLSVFSMLRMISHFFRAYSSWSSVPWLTQAIDAVIGACVATFAIWMFVNRRRIINKVQHAEELKNEISLEVQKTRFVANMSHEIRTPLAAISGYSELLLNSELAYDEVNHAVTAIRRNSHRLSNLVNDILDLSVLEAGKLEIETRSFAPGELLDSVASILGFSALEKGLHLQIVADPNLPALISTDLGRLHQILVTVIGNAVKFTERGTVTVLAKAVRLPGNKSEIQFIVSDTGIGIPAERQESLFIPFSQSDNSTTRKFGGTGIGLALARKLARLLGGDISLLSSSSKIGSSFLISVDSGVTHFSSPNTPTDVQRSSLGGIKILAVDDSADNRDLIRAFLKPSGADVTFAENGLMGVEFALNGNFDIVLMDIQMPELDGHAATRKLRKVGYTKPIIAVTAHAFNEDRHLAFASGFDDHLTKPIERAALYRAIKHFVKKCDVKEISFESAL